MFDEIIEKLLTLKANLDEEKAQKIAEVVQAVEEEFSVRAVKINNMLNECGYVAPIEEVEEANETNESQVVNVAYNETI